MSTVPRSSVKLTYNNKDISKDIEAGLLMFTYIDKEDGEADELEIQLEDSGALWKNGWYPDKGANLTASLYANGQVLECGNFQVDDVEASGPPDTITIKALSDSVTTAIKTKKSTAHENQTLKQIAQSIATAHGYTLKGDIPDITFTRKSQHRKSDVAFLHALAAEYGYAFSIKGTQMVFTSIYSLEAGKAVLTIDRSELKRYNFHDKSADTYKDAKVDYDDPLTGKTISGEYSIEDLKNKDGIDFSTLVKTATNTLQINDKAENEQQAKAKAKAALYNANTREMTLDLDLPGRILLVAGVNFKLTGMGGISGMWHVLKSTHKKTRAGYETSGECKKVGRATASEGKAATPAPDKQVTVVQQPNADNISFGVIQ